MVRKASRLPPTTKSVEEILLERMAGGSTSSGHTARSSAVATSARSSTRRNASHTAAPAPRTAHDPNAKHAKWQLRLTSCCLLIRPLHVDQLASRSSIDLGGVR